MDGLFLLDDTVLADYEGGDEGEDEEKAYAKIEHKDNVNDWSLVHIFIMIQ